MTKVIALMAGVKDIGVNTKVGARGLSAMGARGLSAMGAGMRLAVVVVAMAGAAVADDFITMNPAVPYSRTITNGRLVYVFTNGTSTLTLRQGITDVRYLLVGGGGGGGWANNSSGAAGGGGGMVQEGKTAAMATGGTIAFTIGAGGAGGVSSNDTSKRGTSGANSTLQFGAGAKITATGGGGGGGISTAANMSGIGGANGGGGAGTGSGGIGIMHNGGNPVAAGSGTIAGGGAGAGGDGESGSAAENRAGNGGIGEVSDILGYECRFGGGGGAGACAAEDANRMSGSMCDSWYPGEGRDGGGTGAHALGYGGVLVVAEKGADGFGGGGGGGAGVTKGEPLAQARNGGKGGTGGLVLSFELDAENGLAELMAPEVETRSVKLAAEYVSGVEWEVACGIGEPTAANEELAYRELSALTAGRTETEFSALKVNTEYKYAFRFARGATTNYFASTFKTLPIHGTGGKLKVLDNGKVVHIFDEPGSYKFYPPAGTVTAEILLVGGGGGGGGNAGGGGGAGGMVRLSREIAFGNEMSITVGGGGDGGINGLGMNGDASTVIVKAGTSIISAYGGGGGGYIGSPNGASGGNGGGAVGKDGGAGPSIQNEVFEGASRYGNAGGKGNGSGDNDDLGGGGGGAGAAGGAATGSDTYNGGAGGAGREDGITGESVAYAGGGGGAANYNNHGAKGSGGAGGAGGGGAGAKGSWLGDINGADGVDGLGGGGGGGAENGRGGRGGSGTVIVSYTPVMDELTVVAHHGDMTASSVDVECVLTSTGDGSPAVVLYFDYGETSATWEPVWTADKIVSDYFKPGEMNAYSNTLRRLQEGTEYKYVFMASNVNSAVTGEIYGSFKTMLMPPAAEEAKITWNEADNTYIVECEGTNTVTTYEGFSSAEVRYFIAGGGGGGAAFDGFQKGGGGAGGETKEGTFTLRYGDVIEYQVGQGGVSDNPGGETWIKVNGELVAKAEGGARGAVGGIGGKGASEATGLQGADGVANDISGTSFYYGAGGGAANGATGGSGGSGGRGGVAAAGAVSGGDGVRGSGGGGGTSDGYDGTAYAGFQDPNEPWHYVTASWNAETLLARCLESGEALANGEKALIGATYPQDGIGIGGFLNGDERAFGGEFRELRLSTAVRDPGWLECEGKAATTNFAVFGSTTLIDHFYDLDCAGMAVVTNQLGIAETNGVYNYQIVGLDPDQEYHTRLLLTDTAGNTSVVPRRYSDKLTAEPQPLTARFAAPKAGTAAESDGVEVTVAEVLRNEQDEPTKFALTFSSGHKKFWLFAAMGVFDEGADYRAWPRWEPIAEIGAETDAYQVEAPEGYGTKWRAIRFYAVEWLAPGAMVLDCIETTGTQVLDPKFKPTSEDIRIWLDVTWRQASSDKAYPTLYSIDTGSTANPPYTRLHIGWQGNIFCGNINGVGSLAYYDGSDIIYEVWTKGRKLYWKYNNGNQQGGNAYSTTSSSSAAGDGQPLMFSRSTKVRVYGCKLYDNEVLKRDFVPCLKDGVAQLYDRVSGEFFASATELPFVAGRNRIGEKRVGENFGSSASWCEYADDEQLTIESVVKVDAGTRPARFNLKVATDKPVVVIAAYGANDAGAQREEWAHREQVAAVEAGVVTNLVFTAPAGYNQSWRAVRFFLCEWTLPGAEPLDGITSTADKQWVDTQFCSTHEAQGMILDVTLGERFYSGNTIGLYGIQYAPNADYSGSRFICGYNANIHVGNQGPRMGDFAAGGHYKFDIYTTQDKKCYWKVTGDSTPSGNFGYGNSSCCNKHLTAALFGYTCNYGCGNFAKMTLHAAQLFDNGEMKRDFVPCLKDGEAQLYDRVGKKFYKSENGIPFVAGNPIAGYPIGEETAATETWKEFEGEGEVSIVSMEYDAEGNPTAFNVVVATEDIAGLRLSMAYGAIPGEEEKETWAYVEVIGDFPTGVSTVRVPAPSGFGTRWNDLRFYTEGFWLPPDATELEYIQSSGQAYINTEVMPNIVHGVELGLQEISGTDADKMYLCTSGFYFYQQKWYNTPAITVQSQGQDCSWNYVSTIDSRLNDCAFMGGKLTWNGVIINKVNSTVPISGPYQPISKNDSVPIYLLSDTNGQRSPSARCSYLRLYGEDGELVANLIPCLWQGEAMMFDVVNRRGLKSASATPFTAGPELAVQRVSVGAHTPIWRKYTPLKPDAGNQQGGVMITDVMLDQRTQAPRFIHLKFPQPHDEMVLYMVYGWNGTEKTTNGWEQVKLIGHVSPAAGTTVVNAPQGYETSWNNLRFVVYRYLGESGSDDPAQVGNSLGYTQLWPEQPLATDYGVTLDGTGTAAVSVELASLGKNVERAQVALVVGHPTGDPEADIKEVTLEAESGNAVTNFIKAGEAATRRSFKVTFPEAPDALDFQLKVPVVLHFEEGHPMAFSFADCPSADGIRVYQDGEELPVDVGYWNENGSGEVYVLVPELSKNTELEVVWYPSAEDAPAKAHTAAELWREAGYFAVYHQSNRADEAAPLTDSSENALAAAVNGRCRKVTADQLAAAGITAENWSGTLTMSAWVKPESNDSDCRILSSGRNFIEGFNVAVRKSGMWMMSDGRFMGESALSRHIGAGGRGGDGAVILRYTPAGEMSVGPWVEIFNDASSRKGIWLAFDYRVLWPGRGMEAADLNFIWGPTPEELGFKKPLKADEIGTGTWVNYDMIPGTNWYYAVEAVSGSGAFTSRVHSVSFAGRAVIDEPLAWEDVGFMHLENTAVVDRGIGHAHAYLRWGYTPEKMPYRVYLNDFDCASEEPLSLKLEKVACTVHTQLFYCVEISNYWERLDYWMVTNSATRHMGAWALNEAGTAIGDGTGWKFTTEMTDGGCGVKMRKLTGTSSAYTEAGQYYKHLDFDDPIVDHEFNYAKEGRRYYFDTLGQALTDQIREGGKLATTKTVTLPKNKPLTNWADATFRNCSALEYIENWPKSMKKVPDETLMGCAKLVYNINDFLCADTEEIGWNAYAGCPLLYGVLTIPTAVTNLYSGFRGDSGIIGVNATNVWVLSGDTFAECTELKWAHFSTNRPLVSVGMFMNDYKLSDFLPRPLPTEVKELPDYFFMNCYEMAGLIEDFLPTNLGSIGESAFEECTLFDGEANLRNYTELTNLSPRAFYDCSGIHQAVMPARSLAEIGHEAFFGCASVTNVELNLVDYIGYGAFCGLSSLTNVWFTNMRRNTYLDNELMPVFEGSEDVAFHYHSKLPVVGYPQQPCFDSSGVTNAMPYRFIIYSDRKVDEWLGVDKYEPYNEEDFTKATKTTYEPVLPYRVQGVYRDPAGGVEDRHLLIGPERPTRIHER